MIPRHLHLIWLGGPIPDRLVGRPDDWRRLNPGWDITVWGDDDLAWLQHRELFLGAGPASTRSNVARYEILHRFGGVYADFDMRPVRPLDELGTDHRLLLAEQSPGVLNPALMGGEAGHPFLAHLLAQLPLSWRLHAGAKSPTTTGPHFLTRTWRRWSAVEAGHGALVLEPHMAFPVNHLQADLVGEDFPDALVVHEWDGSWITPGGAAPWGPRRALRRLLDMARTFGARGAPTARGGAGPAVVPMPDGRVLVPLDPGVALLEDLPRIADVVTGGTALAGRVLRMRSVARSGDGVVILGATDAVEAIAAGWHVRRAGRVIVVAADGAAGTTIRTAVDLNVALGMKGDVVVLDPEGWSASGPSAWPRRIPRIGVLWVGTGLRARRLLEQTLARVDPDTIRSILIEMDDGADAAGWLMLADLVRGLGAAGRSVSVLGRDGPRPVEPSDLPQCGSPAWVLVDRSVSAARHADD